MEPIGYQVTIDARDPYAQARFWADVLGFVVEDYDAMIGQLLEQGVVGEQDVVVVDGRRFWHQGAAIRHPDDLGPDGPASPRRVLFARVPEDKTTKNRVHLDLNVGREQIDAEVARVTALGATEQYRVDEPGGYHVTLSDPEGNEFCLQ